MNRSFLRLVLRGSALLIALVFTALWLALGANTGWTKTSVPITVVDDVTGIESQTWEERFVPGIEFLAAGWLLALAEFGVSFIFRDPSTQQQPK